MFSALASEVFERTRGCVLDRVKIFPDRTAVMNLERQGVTVCLLHGLNVIVFASFVRICGLCVPMVGVSH